MGDVRVDHDCNLTVEDGLPVYSLEAVIAPIEIFEPEIRTWPHAYVIELVQGFGLMPMTLDLFNALHDRLATDDDVLGFRIMPAGFVEGFREWSAAGPLAYVEAEFFGGRGRQRAAVWSGGRLVLGPVSFDDDEGRTGPDGPSPISQALACIGIVKDGFPDEFAAAGLDRHRSTDAWLR